MSSRETRKFPHMWDTTLLEAKVLTERWRMDYNTIRKYETTAQRAGGIGRRRRLRRFCRRVFATLNTAAGQEKLTLELARKSKLKTWRIML